MLILMRRMRCLLDVKVGEDPEQGRFDIDPGAICQSCETGHAIEICERETLHVMSPVLRRETHNECSLADR
jgi:hypothetical protein